MTTATSDRTAAAERAADQLREWLLNGPAQQREGAEAGGVAGAIDSNGRARYVYGEITGYYLHWLAQPHADAAALRAERAQQALHWVERRYGAAALPATRIMLVDAAPDWRNDAQFFFDLSMLAGGLAQIDRSGLVKVHRQPLCGLGTALTRFIDADGRLQAALWQRPESAPIARWSTVGGPFMAKAASRALMAETLLALPATLTSACTALVVQVHDLGIHSGIGMLHPTLYAMEGALLASPLAPSPLRHWLAVLLSLQHADGSLPEAPGDTGVRRSDVIAQALRMAVVLDLRAQQPRLAAAIDRLAEALIARVSSRGIAFDPARDAAEANTWCAMFAEQALRAYARTQRGLPSGLSNDGVV